MPVRNSESTRARIIQIIILVLNFMSLILTSLSVGLTIKEYNEPAHIVAGFTKARNGKQSLKEDYEKKIYRYALLVDVAVYYSTALVLSILFFSILIMVATVIEHRKTLIATVVMCGLLAAAALISAIVLFVAKAQGVKMVDKSFAHGIQHYTNWTYPHISSYHHIIDLVQYRAKCCGHLDYGEYNDLFKMKFIVDKNENSLFWCVPKKGLQQVPFTCCIGYQDDAHRELMTECVTNVMGNTVCGNEQNVDGELIHKKGCHELIGSLLSSMDILAALYLTQFIFLVAMTILLNLLTREVVDKQEFILPPVRELQKMGFGEDTIKVLAQNVDDIQPDEIRITNRHSKIDSRNVADSRMPTGSRIATITTPNNYNYASSMENKTQ